MITFLRKLGLPEARNGYLNLTDETGATYGHLFPDHLTKFVIVDQDGRRSFSQKHHNNQMWGTLKNWYRSTGTKAGDTVIVSFNPTERIDNRHVLHLGLFDPTGGKRQEIQATEEHGADPLERDSFPTPEAVDIKEPDLPRRNAVQTYRILRDTALARWLKHLYSFECQICRTTIDLPNGGRYAEVHHIRPLGAPHSGLDSLGNMLVLCPNHHAMCDLGAIHLTLRDLHLLPGHQPSSENLEYHNVTIREAAVQQGLGP